MTPTFLAVFLGVAFAALQLFAIIKPEEFKKQARKFPRSNGAGYILVGIATAWFVYNVSLETVADFAPIQNKLMLGFAALGVCVCIFVKDFIAVRGLAVMLLLLAKLTVDTVRWVDSDWRLVLVTWAYVWVIAGIWFTVSPWRLRDIIAWSIADDGRLKLWSGVRLAFAVLVIGIGLFAF